jgi:putative ABC transport system permease protein
MLQNYITVALRNLARSKMFTFINIGGLGISLASCVFILYFVFDELTFDRFHDKADRIYRVTTTFVDPPNTNRVRITDQSIGPFLKRTFPQVEEYVRFDDLRDRLYINHESIKEEGIYFSDPSVFKVFTYPLVAGNPETVFAKSNSIVLSETLAAKYYRGDAIGKTIDIRGKSYEVTGIMKDVPENSDKRINGLINGNFPAEESANKFFKFDTYILLRKPTDVKEFTTMLNKATEKDWKPMGATFEVQALPDLHFTQGIQMDNAKGNLNNIYIFILIAVILATVAIFNFINLTTVRSLERAKEVGIRKAIGARPFQLVKQFLGESLLAALMAGIVAFLFLKVFYHIFHGITGKTINFTLERYIIIVFCALLLLILVSVIASLYPAWILSSFKPVKVLKGEIGPVTKGSHVRKFFIGVQFMFSTALLICLAVVVRQMNYMQHTNLGFNEDQVLVVQNPGDSAAQVNMGFLTRELINHNLATTITTGDLQSLPGGITGTTNIWYKETGKEHEMMPQSILADAGYISTMQMKLIEGKQFDDFAAPRHGELVLVNEAFIRQTGWKNAIGQKIEMFTFSGRKAVTIIGVLKDFHFRSMHNSIDPLIVLCEPASPGGYLYIRMLPGKLDEVKATWSKVLPDSPFEYLFLDESFNRQYENEEILLALFIYFSVLTIIITGLGLFGIAAYSVEIRTKEIGLRKVMGAGAGSLIRLLSKEFIALTIAGACAGIALSVYAATGWLDRFAYRIDLTFWFVLLPVVIIVLFSVLITSLKILQAVRANPVDSLRYE